MDEKAKQAITIDLNQFKLHIHLKHKTELTLHFDSPSRKFYLSVIALVVNEMKRLGKITSIPFEEHSALLALLNETIGGSAGSSRKGPFASENLQEMERCPARPGEWAAFQGHRKKERIRGRGW